MDLDFSTLPSLKDLLIAHDLWAKKSLGQNFLLDQNITDRIARHAQVKDTCVLEIGPGPGGLTRSLLRHSAHRVIAIEKDPRCIALLEHLVAASSPRLSLINADAMHVDFFSVMEQHHIMEPFHIVANLPYNIGTHLLLKSYQKLEAIQSMTLMFQKEVAERIIAIPKTKDYGRLSVISQFLCETSILFHLPPTAFVPAPKVTSSVVRLIPKVLSENEKSLIPFLEKITHTTFGNRRKMLRSTLKQLFTQEQMEGCALDLNNRPEDLSVQDFVVLAQMLSSSPTNSG